MVSIDGGSPQAIAEKLSGGSDWSPDGNLLLVTTLTDTPFAGGKPSLQIFDLRTGKISVVPSSEGIGGGMWITHDSIVAAISGRSRFVTFDFKTQEWSDLIAADFVGWQVSPDRRYLYFTTGGAEPKVQRLRFADRQIETISSLKGLRQAEDSALFGTQINVAPDGSPVFTRDIGSQEIYALSIR